MTDAAQLDHDAPVINETPTPHHCFGCGALNESGLCLRFRELPGGGVWAEHTPDQRFEGYLGMVHGGVLATMVDEAMSWAISSTGDFAVTARLNSNFRKPALVGRPLRVEGRVVRTRRRLLDTVAWIFDVETGDLVAEAEGVFMRVPPEQAEAWRAAYLAPGSGPASPSGD